MPVEDGFPTGGHAGARGSAAADDRRSGAHPVGEPDGGRHARVRARTGVDGGRELLVTGCGHTAASAVAERRPCGRREGRGRSAARWANFSTGDRRAGARAHDEGPASDGSRTPFPPFRRGGVLGDRGGSVDGHAGYTGTTETCAATMHVVVRAKQHDRCRLREASHTGDLADVLAGPASTCRRTVGRQSNATVTWPNGPKSATHDSPAPASNTSVATPVVTTSPRRSRKPNRGSSSASHAITLSG